LASGWRKLQYCKKYIRSIALRRQVQGLHPRHGLAVACHYQASQKKMWI
jgi:hypothetical protein